MYVSPFTIVSFFLGFPLCAFEFWLSLTFLSISYFMISKEQDEKQIFKFLPVYLYYTHIYLCYIFIPHSPPLKLGGGFLFFKFGQGGGSWKNCSVIEGLVERGWGQVLLQRGGRFQIASSVFIKKSMFSLLLEYFFCLVKIHTCCNLFFHVIDFLLENDILWNFFSFYLFLYIILWKFYY